MKINSQPPVRPFRDPQRGQVLVLTALLLVVLLSAAALVIDLGDVYYSFQELQSATNAAAMAAGASIPAGTAQSAGYAYSGDPNAPANATHNVHSNLNITNVTVTLGCISTTTYPSLGLPPCSVYGTQASANAVQVVETASVATYFAKIFGVPSVTLTATATASAKGGGGKPYDIVMILDTTSSMQSGSDTCTINGSSGSYSQEYCAQEGMQQLMQQLDPCPTSRSTCGTVTNYNVSTPVDRVALMVFPGICASTATGVTTSNCPAATTYTSPIVPNSTYAPADYGCPSTNPPIASYNNNPQYLIVPFSTDYRTSDTATTLNGGTGSGASPVVNSAGAGVGSCSGVQAPGGEGTFYAGVIQTAQNYLTANARTNVQQVIILLSDGDATASSQQMGGSVLTPPNTSVYSSTAECTEAGAAATAAKATINSGLPTLFYSVSYGSETSGCTSGESASYTTPCLTMENMASTPTSEYFFSVPLANGSGTVCSGARSDTTLNQVFTDIAGDLTNSRLIPNADF